MDNGTIGCEIISLCFWKYDYKIYGAESIYTYYFIWVYIGKFILFLPYPSTGVPNFSSFVTFVTY